MGKYFGTDGFRGEANVTLDSLHAYRIGRFLGWYYSANKRANIVIGKDTRISGDMFPGGPGSDSQGRPQGRQGSRRDNIEEHHPFGQLSSGLIYRPVFQRGGI